MSLNKPFSRQYELSGADAYSDGTHSASQAQPYLREVDIETPPHHMPATALSAQHGEVKLIELPRIEIHAFLLTEPLAETVLAARKDRHLAKTTFEIYGGGVDAAVSWYQTKQSPPVIIVEIPGGKAEILAAVEALAGVCQPETRAIIIGHDNDIGLFRTLMQQEVSDYIAWPFAVGDVLSSLSQLYADPKAAAVGRIVAVIGAKGGAGASTIAHNLGFTFAQNQAQETVIADLDLPFGTLGLDFNQDPAQGVAEALHDPERIDATLLERLMVRAGDKLMLLAAPAMLDQGHDFNPQSYPPLLGALRQSASMIVLDIPHLWNDWTRQALIQADHIILVSEPDLASLRNSRNIVEYLKQMRPNDAAPMLILNKAGLPKRPEISESDFARSLGLKTTASIPYEAMLFGAASNNGQMLAEIEPQHKIISIFKNISTLLTGHKAQNSNHHKSVFEPLLAKFLTRKA